VYRVISIRSVLKLDVFETRVSSWFVSTRSIDMANLKRLLRYLRPHIILVITVISLMILSTFLEIQPTAVLKRILDIALPAKDAGLVTHLLWVYVGLWFLKGLANYVQWYCSELIGQKVIYEIRQSLHDHLQVLPPSLLLEYGYRANYVPAYI